MLVRSKTHPDGHSVGHRVVSATVVVEFLPYKSVELAGVLGEEGAGYANEEFGCRRRKEEEEEEDERRKEAGGVHSIFILSFSGL